MHQSHTSHRATLRPSPLSATALWLSSSKCPGIAKDDKACREAQAEKPHQKNVSHFAGQLPLPVTVVSKLPLRHSKSSQKHQNLRRRAGAALGPLRQVLVVSASLASEIWIFQPRQRHSRNGPSKNNDSRIRLRT